MIEKISFLTERPFAHRGLHSGLMKDKGTVPENSLEAFKLAIEKNYSIEMDVHLTKDLNIIVFHDFFLGRLTTKKGYVFKKDLQYIKQARLMNNETVPTIEEVLNLIGGKVPILLEIKYSNYIKNNLEVFIRILSEKLNSYNGPLALMSFSMDLMFFISQKKLFNRFPLGLTTSFPKCESVAKKIKNDKLENNIIASNLRFISQNWIGLKNSRIKKLKKLGIVILSWTITSKEIEKMSKDLVDNITFEQYEPGISE